MGKQQFGLIIPAAGAGKRLGEEIPKPYLRIGGKTILEHTLLCFKPIQNLGEVIVSTSGQYLVATEDILNTIFPDIKTAVVVGGAERQHSIRNAMAEISGKTGLIAVHDAVRPFVSESDINKCLEQAMQWGGAVLGVPAKDTIKQVNNQDVVQSTPNRKYLWQAQTPQIFWAALLREAYDHAELNEISGFDDATLVEKAGGKVVMVEGSSKNFKITYPLDLEIAQFLMQRQSS